MDNSNIDTIDDEWDYSTIKLKSKKKNKKSLPPSSMDYESVDPTSTTTNFSDSGTSNDRKLFLLCIECNEARVIYFPLDMYIGKIIKSQSSSENTICITTCMLCLRQNTSRVDDDLQECRYISPLLIEQLDIYRFVKNKYNSDPQIIKSVDGSVLHINVDLVHGYLNRQCTIKTFINKNGGSIEDYRPWFF